LIGGILEEATEPPLRELVDRHGLFLDVKGLRPGIRDGRLLSLPDADGNFHDLDFVIERSHRPGAVGQYAAFVECAWRRYTKHSKAKAQEIQGAVLPLVRKWAAIGPTPAAVVAGQWSRPSIKQLESSGFVVLQLDFQATVDVFASFGVDIKGRDKVPDAFWQRQVDKLRALSSSRARQLAAMLRAENQDDFESFIAELEERIIRHVQAVMFYPIHGRSLELGSLTQAMEAVQAYSTADAVQPFVRFEFEVVYSNGDTIRANYSSVQDSLEFLGRLL